MMLQGEVRFGRDRKFFVDEFAIAKEKISEGLVYSWRRQLRFRPQ